MSPAMRLLFEQLLSGFLLLGIFKRMKSRASLMKIKAAQVYVLGVKKTRIFFLAILFVILALVFLVNGLNLLQSAFFIYSMWTNQEKFLAALILGGIEFLAAVGVIVYLFREETWGQFLGVEHIVNSAINESGKNNDSL